MKFDPQLYWETRLRKRFTLDGVGYEGLGLPFNNWMYKLRRHHFLYIIKKLIPNPSEIRVLDVGSGTGFLVNLWKSIGVRNLVGIDLTKISVDNLKKQYPEYQFRQLDIASSNILNLGKFDVISASDVLFHIVDDKKYKLAIKNIRRLLRNNGIFIFSENFVHKSRIGGVHQVCRTYEEILSILNHNGFHLVMRKPLFFLMNAPVDSKNRLLGYYWKGLSKVLGRFNFLGYLLGPLLFLIDYFLTGIFKEGPSTEVAVCVTDDKKDPLRVLIISYMYPSRFNEVGGIFVHQQVKELQKQGCEVKVVSPVPWAPFPIKYFSRKWKKYSEIPKKQIWDGVEVYHPRYLEFPKALFLASSGKRMYWGIKKTVSEIYKNFKFDIIHSHVALPDGYAGMLLAEKYNKPFVVTIHGQDFQQTIHRSKSCRENIKRVISFSRKTIVVSNKLKRIGEKELKIAPDKLVIIPNGVNFGGIYKNQSSLFPKYENKRIILSVSRLIKSKGIDYNIKAIGRLKEKNPDLIYLIIGDDPERRVLEKLVKELDLQENVKFLGQLPHLKVMEYMAICDIFSLPSWNEAFGIVYAEAMANAKPVIGCEGEGCEDFIKNGETGILVKPRDVDGLAKAIDFLISNPEKAKEMGERAKKLIWEHYTLEKITQKLIETYNQILKEYNNFNL